jgi:hypothetical protein
VENKPKKSLLQSLLAFFKGMRKQDTEKSPTESASKGEPIKKEPAQTAQTQPQQPGAQTPPATPVQPPTQTQPRQPVTQTPPTAPVQPPVQAQPRRPVTQAPPAAPAQPQITTARTPVVSPDSPVENKPKKSLLQSLLAFFKGMRKQDTEKPPTASKGEPIKKEPVQTPPAQTRQQSAAQAPDQTKPRQPVAQAAPSTAPAQPRQQPAVQAPPAAPAPPRSGSAEKNGKFPLWILLPIVFLPIIAIIVFLFFLIRWKLRVIPVRSVSYVAGRTVASPPRRDVTAKLDTNPMVYLEVDDQNRNIGRRNTHSLKAGSIYTVGGGKSDFLIFLVPLPPSIGILKFDGKECTFIPQKPRYFPEISGEPVPDCIEKTIRVISDSGYKLSFRFKPYEDPLLVINRTMNSAGTSRS